jgi:hypothetical protein
MYAPGGRTVPAASVLDVFPISLPMAMFAFAHPAIIPYRSGTLAARQTTIIGFDVL